LYNCTIAQDDGNEGVEAMFDAFTGWKVGVECTETDGSYVIVPPDQADALCRLLTEHCVPYALDGEVPSRHHAEAPAELVVRLGFAIEVALVQNMLDSAP
jgi:hypothetical protein